MSSTHCGLHGRIAGLFSSAPSQDGHDDEHTSCSTTDEEIYLQTLRKFIGSFMFCLLHGSGGRHTDGGSMEAKGSQGDLQGQAREHIGVP
jgi:hypothetical protein